MLWRSLFIFSLRLFYWETDYNRIQTKGIYLMCKSLIFLFFEKNYTAFDSLLSTRKVSKAAKRVSATLWKPACEVTATLHLCTHFAVPLLFDAVLRLRLMTDSSFLRCEKAFSATLRRLIKPRSAQCAYQLSAHVA